MVTEMRVVKRITNYDVEPEVDIYLVSGDYILIHAIRKAWYRNTFEEKGCEHPMKITESPWNLFDIDNPDWIFKRANDNVEEIMVLTEVNRMRLSEFGKTVNNSDCTGGKGN